MQLLEHFKELSLHPKNTKELKGLILQLAIQGKLTAKWREENPELISGKNSAESLLQKIKAEKAQLVKEKIIKKDKEFPAITDDEIPFEIPESWKFIRLIDIGTTNVGLTYSPKSICDDGIPVLRSSNIQKGKIDLVDLVRVNQKYADKDVLNIGDLLICARNGSRRLVGKCAIIEKSNELMLFGAFMAIYRSKFNDYVKLFIESPTYRSRLEGVETTTINQITQSNLKATVLPFPSQNEQKQIVQKVNQLFKEVEQLEQLTEQRVQLKEHFATSALKKLTEEDTQASWSYLKPHFKAFFNEESNIKQLRESILQLAVQGKLTAKWRAEHYELISGENSAHNLLQKIKAEKAQLIKDKKIKKEKPLPAITEDEIPFEIPEGWVWCNLISVCIKVTDGFHHTPTKRDAGFIYISATHIKDKGVLWQDCLYIGEKEHLELFKKAAPRKGDILIVNRGAGCGTPAVVDIDEPFSFQNAALIGFNQSAINSKFMYYFILQKRSEIMDYFTNGGAQPMLSNKILKTLFFPLLPYEEQKVIVEKVNSLMAFCDQLEQEITKSKQLKEHWMVAILREEI
jgi:type I restriction enzyme S subunit